MGGGGGGGGGSGGSRRGDALDWFRICSSTTSHQQGMNVRPSEVTRQGRVGGGQACHCFQGPQCNELSPKTHRRRHCCFSISSSILISVYVCVCVSFSVVRRPRRCGRRSGDGRPGFFHRPSIDETYEARQETHQQTIGRSGHSLSNSSLHGNPRHTPDGVRANRKHFPRKGRRQGSGGGGGKLNNVDVHASGAQYHTPPRNAVGIHR